MNKNYPIRYKAMKKDLKLTNKDFAEMSGNTPDSVEVVTSGRVRFPGWARAVVEMYEKYIKKDSFEYMLEKLKKDDPEKYKKFIGGEDHQIKGFGKNMNVPKVYIKKDKD